MEQSRKLKEGEQTDEGKDKLPCWLHQKEDQKSVSLWVELKEKTGLKKELLGQLTSPDVTAVMWQCFIALVILKVRDSSGKKVGARGMEAAAD